MSFREAFKHIGSYPNTFWILLCTTLMNQIGNMAVVFLVIYLSKYLDFTLAEASFAFAAFGAMTLVSGIVGGTLITKFGPIYVLAITLIINGLVMLVFPLVHYYPFIILLSLLWGFVFGLNRPTCQTVFSYLSAPGMHKLTFSMYRTVLNLGMSIGPALGGFLAGYSFTYIFIANGLANLLASLILIIGFFHSNIKVKPPAQREADLEKDWLNATFCLRLMVLAIVPISMVFFQHQTTLGIFLNDKLHPGLTFYGLLFTLNTLCIVCFELLLNIATLHWSYRFSFIFGSALITIGFAGFVFATQFWHVILLTLIWTLGEMILYPAASSYIADTAPEIKRANYLSLYNMSCNLGMLLGPCGGALVMAHFGAKDLWIACGVVGLVSMVMFYYLREPGALLNPSQTQDAA